MLLSELADPTEDIIKNFVRMASKRLGLKRVPRVRIVRDTAYSSENHSFGHYDPEGGELLVQIEGRHILDILRTLAHELTHARQDERGDLQDTSGETGSDEENQANALAGVIMRDFNQSHPELFARSPE